MLLLQTFSQSTRILWKRTGHGCSPIIRLSTASAPCGRVGWGLLIGPYVIETGVGSKAPHPQWRYSHSPVYGESPEENRARLLTGVSP